MLGTILQARAHNPRAHAVVEKLRSRDHAAAGQVLTGRAYLSHTDRFGTRFGAKTFAGLLDELPCGSFRGRKIWFANVLDTTETIPYTGSPITPE